MFILLHVKVYLISLTEIMLKLIVSSLKIVLRARNLQKFKKIQNLIFMSKVFRLFSCPLFSLRTSSRLLEPV